MINLDYKSGLSLHEQIAEGIRQHIINGIMKSEEQLPSVRELAISLTVNPNTVQRAYKQLELEGFIYSIKGKGNFVAKVTDDASSVRKKELYEVLFSAARELAFLGESEADIAQKIKEVCSEKEGGL